MSELCSHCRHFPFVVIGTLLCQTPAPSCNRVGKWRRGKGCPSPVHCCRQCADITQAASYYCAQCCYQGLSLQGSRTRRLHVACDCQKLILYLMRLCQIVTVHQSHTDRMSPCKLLGVYCEPQPHLLEVWRVSFFLLICIHTAVCSQQLKPAQLC